MINYARSRKVLCGFEIINDLTKLRAQEFNISATPLHHLYKLWHMQRYVCFGYTLKFKRIQIHMQRSV